MTSTSPLRHYGRKTALLDDGGKMLSVKWKMSQASDKCIDTDKNTKRNGMSSLLHSVVVSVEQNFSHIFMEIST